MNAAHWHLTFANELVSEPVLWDLSQRFGLQTNIRRANVEEHVGWVIVEVRGDRLDEARDWLVERGVQVADLPG
jgi:ABC-type methionine transport system ATPase subunit